MYATLTFKVSNDLVPLALFVTLATQPAKYSTAL